MNTFRRIFSLRGSKSATGWSFHSLFYIYILKPYDTGDGYFHVEGIFDLLCSTLIIVLL